MKKILAFLLTAVMLLSMTTVFAAAEGDIVTLKWVQVGNGMPANYDAWKTNIDAYLEEKIGVHIEMEIVPWGDWDTRRNIIVNTNEPFDILFTNSGTFNRDVRLGIFADITDAVKTASPELYSFIPEMYWNATSIDGKIYGIPTYKDSSQTNYFVWDKVLTDKYEIDAENIHTLKDATEGLLKIKEGENITPFPLAKEGQSFFMSQKYDTLGAGLNEMGVRVDDGEMKVVAVFEQEEILDELKTLHEWYNAGIINADAATAPERPKYHAFGIAQGWPAAAKTNWGPNMGTEVVVGQYGNTVVSNETVQGSISCIWSGSENIEKALEFLQLVNTDSYLRDSLFYGLEGDNWDYTEEGRVHRHNTDFGMAGYTQGTFFVVTPTDDVDFNQWDEVRALNEAATPSVMLGFIFDTTPIEDELANCKSIHDRYWSELSTGTSNPEEAIPAMMAEMRASGFDKIVEEAQNQIDAWAAVSK